MKARGRVRSPVASLVSLSSNMLFLYGTGNLKAYHAFLHGFQSGVIFCEAKNVGLFVWPFKLTRLDMGGGGEVKAMVSLVTLTSHLNSHLSYGQVLVTSHLKFLFVLISWSTFASQAYFTNENFFDPSI